MFVLMLYVIANTVSVMSGRFPVFLGLTSIKQRIKYLVQEHNAVPTCTVNLELATI